MERLIQIYAKNSQDVEDVYSIHKVCQCVADDELFAETGIEPEVLEIFSYYNKQMVNELRSDRTASYDYLQKQDEVKNSENDEESQSQENSNDDESENGRPSEVSMQTSEAEALIHTQKADVNLASLIVRQGTVALHDSTDFIGNLQFNNIVNHESYDKK